MSSDENIVDDMRSRPECPREASEGATPTATVIVVSDGDAAAVSRTLRALERQLTPGHNVVVIDTSRGPVDETSAGQRSGVDHGAARDARSHPADMCNTAVRRVSSDFIAFLRAGGVADERWLSELVVRFDSPAVAVVGGRSISHRRSIGLDAAANIGWLLPDGRLTYHFESDPPRDVDVDHVDGDNMCIRRTLFDEMGGFAADYPPLGGWTTTDFCLRAGVGRRLVFTPSATVDFTVHEAGRPGSDDALATAAHHAAHMFLLLKTRGPASSVVRAFVITELQQAAFQTREAVRAAMHHRHTGVKLAIRAASPHVLRACALLSGAVWGTVRWTVRGRPFNNRPVLSTASSRPRPHVVPLSTP